MRTRLRRRHIAAVLTGSALLSIVPFLGWSGAEGEAPIDQTPTSLVVIGDSITARYNDEPGHLDQGWWSVVARHYRADVRTYAQNGSGYLRPGLACTGDRFRDRVPAFLGPAPSVFIIEGGRNDWAKCVDGSFRTATDAEIRAAVNEYMDIVDHLMPATTRVLVVTPCGPRQPIEQMRVIPIIRTAAVDHGFEFVDTTGVLGPDAVVDGVHPNRAGNLAIADRVIAAIG